MTDFSEILLAMFFGALFGLALGLCLGHDHVCALHREAIESGAAYYQTDVAGRSVFTWNNGMSASVQK